MSAAAPPSATPPASAAGIESNDPLGYDTYAKTLWARIDQAVNRDRTDAKNPKLRDDPLVVGLFGEWGVGKTYLLDKILDHATARSHDRSELRKGDGGFGLTIPVYFQPWKYEYEAHLHVPLVLHVLKALEDGVKASLTFWELAANKAQGPGDAVIKALPQIVKAGRKLFGATTAALEPVSGAALHAAQAMADHAATPKQVKVGKSTDLKHTDDGRYFYEIHQVLKAITRPGKYKADYLPKTVVLNENFAVNFVVFVDDLDRCLPEKAVQVLELIKTVFNVESFAFVDRKSTRLNSSHG